jgi:hypothetical protein
VLHFLLETVNAIPAGVLAAIVVEAFKGRLLPHRDRVRPTLVKLGVIRSRDGVTAVGIVETTDENMLRAAAEILRGLASLEPGTYEFRHGGWSSSGHGKADKAPEEAPKREEVGILGDPRRITCGRGFE